MLGQLYYLNKLRRNLGIKNALSVFINFRITKSGIAHVDFIRYPFRNRLNNIADSSTFTEVIMRQEYTLNIPFTPATIIDAGANIGLTAIFFANKYPEAKIISIEPASDNFALLLENTKPYPQIQAIQSGVWSKKTNLRLIDNGRGANSYSVAEAEIADKHTFPAISIGDIMQQQNWPTIDLLKMDVEGAEKELFSNNYERWLPKTKVLVVETHDRFVKGSSRPLFAAISKLNFSCKLQGFNLVFINEDLL